MNILQKIRGGITYFDGGLGTELQKRGLPAGVQPWEWNITNPRAVIEVHKSYVEAGCNIICANTFGANELKIHGEYTVEEVIEAAINNAKQAIAEAGCRAEDCFVAFDLGSSGRMLEPFGDYPFEAAVELFARGVRCAEKCGADLIAIETMTDSYEVKAAVLAAKENSSLPVFCSTVFDENCKLMTGADVPAMVAMLEGMGVDAIGMNCSLGPKQMKGIVPDFAEYASVPIIVCPNAGLPKIDGDKTYYDVSPAEFAADMADIVRSGARIVGGCCGTTPEYMRELIKATKDIQLMPLTAKSRTLVSSYTHAVEFGSKPVLIGERINPTGKQKLKAALREKNIDYILDEGFNQKDKGAQLLDVNVGLPEIDEPELLCLAVRELQAVIDLPLQLDTADAVAMEKAMRIYSGKPLVNSVNGKEESMKAVFPLVKKYGGVVIALTLDESGIPATAEGRAAIAKKIIDTAAEYGIDKKDIIVDPLALAISSDTACARETLGAIKLIKSELGVCTSLGVSNVSFGLPNRDIINSTFFAMALEAGLDAAIMNPYSQDMLKTYHAFCALAGKDPNCAGYIEFAGNYVPAAASAASSPQKQGLSAVQAQPSLQGAIVKGFKEQAGALAAEMLGSLPASELIAGHIIPALDIVGMDFETNKVFLPQLLMSAEAAKEAFAAVRASLKSGENGSNKGKVILASVKGDIHDIGKNIVKVLLENYGFEVIDLGRDVDYKVIVDAAVTHGVKLVGLSALMTTTVASMEETIRQLKAKAPGCATVVGGAVLTQEYANMIGADYYAKDAMETVRIAENILCKE